MATISTSIELYDRVSAPVTKMIAALGNMCDAFESVESSMDDTFDTSSIEQARRATEQAALEVIQLGNDIEQNQNHQEDFNRSVRSGESAMGGLAKKVVGLVAAYASMQGIKQAMNISDELTQTTARLDMMNDGLQTTDELVKLVYQSAQNARGSFSDMADVVARFGNNAKDAFSSNEEVVAFANLIQKQMTIAGAGTQEASNAMLQLSQALGSGVLRGDELNSIFEQAPNIIQSIADYLNVPIGTIREMASEGQLTADIVKAAIFASTDEINAQFENMPMTWNQAWTKMKNTALMTFQPVLQKLNELVNSEAFQTFANNAIEAFAIMASVLLDIFNFVSMIGNFISENWSVIEPIIMGIVTALGLYAAALLITNIINGIAAIVEGVKAAATAMGTGATFAATAAQYGFNAALLACPLTWIILLIIALIAVIVELCNWIAQTTGAASSGIGIIVGSISVAVAFIANIFVALINMIIDIFVVLWNFIAAFVNFFGNVFTDPIGSIARLFFDLVDCILGLLQTLAGAIDAIFGSNLSGAVQGWRDDLGAWVDDTFGKGEEIMAKVSGEDWHVDRFEYGDAWKTGTELGDGIADKISNFSLDSLTGNIPDDPNGTSYDYSGYDASQVPSNIADTAGNTGSMADSLAITSEDLKYLRDIAETEAVNKFTTAEIKVEMTNNNNVSSDMDLDGIVDYLANGVNEAMQKAAEGVHV